MLCLAFSKSVFYNLSNSTVTLSVLEIVLVNKKKKENKRTVRIKYYQKTLNKCGALNNGPILDLNSASFSCWSWHHASTKNFVDLTSPVFDLIRLNKEKT